MSNESLLRTILDPTYDVFNTIDDDLNALLVSLDECRAAIENSKLKSKFKKDLERIRKMQSIIVDILNKWKDV